ncbi:GNAT family N-acetyltransferase [Flavihumibacter rivuli]|uniref:GNAT family N-acetyltransferase n=1 Tax=Flavihumibacter rivuli TaxID=2838156 RepID=UPI001BDE4456|nr:GNAT family N-acetyltransferase [Flavihumibacter rivuli]ULQ55478.1 GNAT family N-acetyltransferase [Flavihumibacter rivuli]
MKDPLAIKIEIAKEQHLDALRNLFLETRQQTFTWADPTQYTLPDFDQETEGEYILVAMADDKIIGFISVWLPDRFIHHLYVAREYHHHGVGTALLNAAIDHTGYPIGLKCLVKNEAALEFYQRKGFSARSRGGSEGEAFVYLVLEE